jgi:hypothetical protein
MLGEIMEHFDNKPGVDQSGRSSQQSQKKLTASKLSIKTT